MKTKHLFPLLSVLLLSGGVAFADVFPFPDPNLDAAPGDGGIKPAPADKLAGFCGLKQDSHSNTSLVGEFPKHAQPSCGDPVGVVSGVVVDRETDFIVRCPGIDLVFQRTFDGEFVASRDLPEGWCHNYEWRLVPSDKDPDWMVLRALSNPGGVSAFHHFQRLSGGGWGVSDNAPFVLSENGDGTWTMKSPGPVLYRFGEDGWLDSITARTGETVAVDRGANREHVLRVSHSCGRSLVFQYGADGVVSSIRANDGTALEFEQFPGAFDASGRMVSWTNEFRRVSGGRVSRMRYVGRLVPFEAGSGTVVPADSAIDPVPVIPDAGTVQYCLEPIVRKIDEDGTVTTYVYRRYMDSPRGRVVFASTDDGFFATKLVHETGQTEVTSPLGDGASIESTYVYDPDTRRILSRTNGSGVFETDWTVQGDVVRARQSDSATGSAVVRESLFGAWHNETNVVFALDSALEPSDAWRTEWEPGWLLPTWTRSPEGRVSGIVRDETSRTIASFGAGPDSTRLRTVVQCDESWHAIASTNANGVATFYEYDDAGELVRIRTEGHPSEEYAYDALGHLREVRLPGPGGSVRVTAITNNPFGKPLRIDHPDGTSQSYVYDNSWCQATEHVDELGRTDHYENYLGRRLHTGRTIAGSTNEILLYRLEVDKQFNMVAIRDPMGRRVERYVLDDQGRIACVTNLEGQAQSFRYRLGGLVDRIDRFDSSAVTFDYDSRACLSSVAYPDETLAFSYDRDGLLLSASNSAGTVSAVYDETGWATNVVGADGTEIVYGYHDGGQVSSVASVAGITTYSLDEGDRVSRIEMPDAAFDFGYGDWNGLVTSITNDAGLVTEFAYDLRDRLTNVVYRSPSGAELARFDYSLDAIGRITERTADIRSGGASRPRRAVFAYDDLDRLVSESTFASNIAPRTLTYAYDLAGNRLRKTDTASGAVDYTLGLGDRLASFTGGAYEYDVAGCVTNISGGASSPSEPLSRALAWNAQYQLLSVSTNGAFAESYTWDPLGRRATTTTAEGTVRHVYDGDECIADLDETGAVVRSYVWGPGIDNLLSVAVADGNGQPRVYYALTDHQNTVHGFVDATGALVAHFVYDAWGNVLESSVSVPALADNRYLFQGREYSWATGLYNFRARWYDSATGRWLSKDPIGINGGLNLYVFCGNSPSCLIDPKGTWNLWNPSTWGIRNPVNWSVVDSLKPFHESAGTYFSMDATIQGLSAFLDGINPFGDPLSTYYTDKCGIEQNGTEYSRLIGTGTLITEVGLVTLFPQGICSGASQAVTHWGPEGMTGLRVGDWVMTGGASLRNWLLAGCPGQFRTWITETVPKSALKFPKGWEWIKGLFGQRIYEP